MVMADNPQPNNDSSSDQYARGLQAGCLLGCSPLIFLFLLVILMGGGSFFGGGSGKMDIPAPVPLPVIEPTAPVASLLPTPPRENTSPVYLGDDLSCVPELMIEAAEKATKEEWQQRKAHAVAAALQLNRSEEDGYLKALL